MVIAAGPTAGGVEWAAETRLAGGGGWVGAGGGEEGGRGEEARRGGGGCVRLAVGDDGVGDSRARRRRRCAEGEREGERFGHGEAGGNRRGLGVIRGRSGGGGTGAAARETRIGCACQTTRIQGLSGECWAGRPVISLKAAYRPNSVNEWCSSGLVWAYGAGL